MNKSLMPLFLGLFSLSISVSADPLGWSEPLQIVTNLSSDIYSHPVHDLGIDSENNLHVVWKDIWREIYYKKFDRNGKVIISDSPIYLDNNRNFAYSRYPSLQIDKNDNVHIIWTGTGLIGGTWNMSYRKLDNNGNNLTDTLFIGEMVHHGYSQGPSTILDSQNNLHLFWISYHEIFYKKFDNNGKILINDLQLTNTSRRKQLPSVTLDSFENLHLIWADSRDWSRNSDTSDAYYRKMSSNGAFLSPEIRLTFNQSIQPKIVADLENNLHIIFVKLYAGGSELFHIKLNNNGLNLTGEKMILEPDGFGSYYHLAKVDSKGDINLIWKDDRLQERRWHADIFYKKLDKDGVNLTPDIPVIVSPIEKFRPVFLLDAMDNIHIVWDHYLSNNFPHALYYIHSLPPQLMIQGTPHIGNPITLNISDPLNPNTQYILFMALSNTTGILLDDGRKIPLDYDSVFETSLFYPNVIGLIGAQGKLDEYGRATVTWNIPNIPGLAGYKVYFSYVTVYPDRPMPRLINSIAEVKDVTLVS